MRGELDDVIVELDSPGTGDHDVDLLGRVVFVAEGLPLAGLERVEAEAGALCLEVAAAEARLLDLAHAELGGGVLDLSEVLERVGRRHWGSFRTGSPYNIVGPYASSTSRRTSDWRRFPSEAEAAIDLLGLLTSSASGQNSGLHR